MQNKSADNETRIAGKIFYLPDEEKSSKQGLNTWVNYPVHMAFWSYI